MSRIGKLLIPVPASVEITLTEGRIQVKGPKGTLEHAVHPAVSVAQEADKLVVQKRNKGSADNAFWGLTRSIIAGLVQGVSLGFEKRLKLQGVGYRANVQGKKLVLSIGYSHPVEFNTPEGIVIAVAESVISVSGSDKQLVGQVASDIRAIRPPEPYKGKGIRYENEHVRRKAGKAAAGATGATA